MDEGILPVPVVEDRLCVRQMGSPEDSRRIGGMKGSRWSAFIPVAMSLLFPLSSPLPIGVAQASRVVSKNASFSFP